MLEAQLTQPQWIGLSQEVKDKLINIFHIPRTEPTKVNQGFHEGKLQTVVSSDGHSHKDLSVISVKAMQEFLGSDKTDFYALFEDVVNKISTTQRIDLEAEAKKVEHENVAKWLTILTDIKAKATELGLLDQFLNLANEIFNVQPIQKTTKQGAKNRA